MNRTLFALLVLSSVFACCHGQVWKAGASSITILPTVNGTTDYWAKIPPTDCCSAGTFVQQFDVGEVAVGNGDGTCHWIRNDIFARAAAIGPDPNGRIAVFVSVEVYMLFKNDLAEYYEMVREQVGDTLYNNLYFLVHAQHNHEGPDTRGLEVWPINHEYYRYMLEQMTKATVNAINSMEDAYLFFGQEQFYYGLGDIRDPLMQDSTLRVLRAYRNQNRQGAPIFTMANWGMHPEVTLGYVPQFDSSDCLKLTPPQPGCSAKGRYFTSDYPGYFSEVMKDLQGGGEALYFNGAIGCQIGTHNQIWEVTPQYPLGNGSVVPPGATIVDENFRGAYLIGKELAVFADQIPLVNSQPIPYGEFEYHQKTILARVTNFFFRIALVPQSAVKPNGDPNRPFRLGNTLRPAYVCSGNQPTLADCIMDNFTYTHDNFYNLPYRIGNWMDTETRMIRLGPMKFVAIPGELAPELSAGLPYDFDTPAGTTKYYDEPEKHATGRDYTMPGVVMDMITSTPEEPCWVFGLTQDEIGYMFPISDWRIKCVGSDVDCLTAFEAGALDYEDSASGVQCKNLVENPVVYEKFYTQNWGIDTWNLVNQTCVYGQMAGEVSDHYEETNSASWDAASLFIEAVAEMVDVAPSGRYCSTNCNTIGEVP